MDCIAAADNWAEGVHRLALTPWGFSTEKPHTLEGGGSEFCWDLRLMETRNVKGDSWFNSAKRGE